MLKQEFQYYLDHQPELVAQHVNKYIVIRGQEVVGAYSSQIEAYNEASSKYELGTFLIQHCLAGKESYTQTFHSRVVLSL